MLYAAAHPDHVASLVLVGPALPAPPAREAIGKSVNARIATLTRDGVLPNPLPPDPMQALNAMLPAYFSNPRFPIPQALKRTTFTPQVLREISSSMRGLDLRPKLATLNLRVLIAFGDDISWATPPPRPRGARSPAPTRRWCTWTPAGTSPGSSARRPSTARWEPLLREVTRAPPQGP